MPIALNNPIISQDLYEDYETEAATYYREARILRQPGSLESSPAQSPVTPQPRDRRSITYLVQAGLVAGTPEGSSRHGRNSSPPTLAIPIPMSALDEQNLSKSLNETESIPSSPMSFDPQRTTRAKLFDIDREEIFAWSFDSNETGHPSPSGGSSTSPNNSKKVSMSTSVGNPDKACPADVDSSVKVGFSADDNSYTFQQYTNLPEGHSGSFVRDPGLPSSRSVSRDGGAGSYMSSSVAVITRSSSTSSGGGGNHHASIEGGGPSSFLGGRLSSDGFLPLTRRRSLSDSSPPPPSSLAIKKLPLGQIATKGGATSSVSTRDFTVSGKGKERLGHALSWSDVGTGALSGTMPNLPPDISVREKRREPTVQHKVQKGCDGESQSLGSGGELVLQGLSPVEMISSQSAVGEGECVSTGGGGGEWGSVVGDTVQRPTGREDLSQAQPEQVEPDGPLQHELGADFGVGQVWPAGERSVVPGGREGGIEGRIELESDQVLRRDSGPEEPSTVEGTKTGPGSRLKETVAESATPAVKISAVPIKQSGQGGGGGGGGGSSPTSDRTCRRYTINLIE